MSVEGRTSACAQNAQLAVSGARPHLVRKSSVDEIKAGAKAPLGTRCAGADGVVRIDAGHWGIPAAT